jgi:hypothetical protein
MKALRAVVLVVGVSCGSSRPSVPPPLPTPAPLAGPSAVEPVAKPVEPAKPMIPDTAAGRTMAAWLDAFNSGDAPRMKEFVKRYQDPEGDMIVPFREQTGGFDVVAIQKSEPRSVTFVVQEKASSTQAVGWLRVGDGEPATMDMFTLLAIPPGMTAADMRIDIDAETPARIVDAIATQLHDFYVYPDVAKNMAQAIRQHLEHGDYKTLTTGPELASALTDHLLEVSHDHHLHVQWEPQAIPQDDAEPSEDDKARMKEQLDKMNCGFVKAERLDGNIGYIKFNMFGPVDVCGPKATEAFAAVADVDALIFDLRENGGGQPEMVAYVVSYLFAKRTHINDIYERKDNKTTQYWTKPDVPGKKLATQPVYVLTSARTFSGAEEFCYDLQNTKRATIVGEVTGGGAHPTTGKRLDDHFMIGVPFARAINPVTKTDWEGKGIQPEVKVPADEALEKAKQLAAEKLAKLHKPRK